MKRDWPEFPEDQAMLPGFEQIPEQPVADKTDPAAQTKRKPSLIEREDVTCRVCGEVKTLGLPCPWCAEKGK